MTKARILADYVAGGTTAAEFDYMDGVTSNVQTQIDAKAPTAGPTFTGTVAIPNVANLETAVVANTAKVTNSTNASDLASGTIADARMPNLTGAITTVEGAVATTIANDAVDSQHYAAGSIDNEHLADDAVGSDELANDVTISTSGTITSSAGITETGGVLKENLLTNSGFDVWSNSTQKEEEVVTNGIAWTGATGATGPNDWAVQNGGTWTIQTIDAVLGLNFTVNTALSINPRISANSATAVSTFYKISFKAKVNNGHFIVSVGSSAYGSTQYKQWAVNPTEWTDYSLTFEATSTTVYYDIYLQASTNGHYGFLANFSILELTPGCIAADSKAPDGWNKQTRGNIYRQNPHATYTKDGSYYSLFMDIPDSADETVFGGYNVSSDNSYEKNIEMFLGRKITLGVWCYATKANHAELSAYDNVNGASSIKHTGSAGWQWLEVTHTVASNATTLYSFRLYQILKANDATDKIWWSQPMLVFGSSIGSGNYTRPKGEIIWFEKFDDLTDYTGAAITSPAQTIDLEVQSQGKIPKSAKAIYCNVAGQGAGVDNELVLGQDSADERGIWMITSVITPRYMSANGWVPCDVNGDIYVWLTGSWADARIRVTGVELH